MTHTSGLWPLTTLNLRPYRYGLKYEGYQESKFRLRILLLQHGGHDGAHACRVFLFFVKARTQFADI